MTTTTEPVTWGDLRAELFRDKRVTQTAVADKLRISRAEFAARMRAADWTVAPEPRWAATVFQAIEEVKADLDAGRGQ